MMNASKAARQVLSKYYANTFDYCRRYNMGFQVAADALMRWEIRRALRAERLRGRAEGAKMALDELRTAKKGE